MSTSFTTSSCSGSRDLVLTLSKNFELIFCVEFVKFESFDLIVSIPLLPVNNEEYCFSRHPIQISILWSLQFQAKSPPENFISQKSQFPVRDRVKR